jgi:hypothetical protein
MQVLAQAARPPSIKEAKGLLSFSPHNEGGAEALGEQRIHNGTKPTILTSEALAALKERIEVRSVHDRAVDAPIAIDYSIQQPRPRHPDAATEEDHAAL